VGHFEVATGGILWVAIRARICLTCQLKVANLLKAFGIDRRSLFPGIGERKLQDIVYEEIPMVVRGKDDVLH